MRIEVKKLREAYRNKSENKKMFKTNKDIMRREARFKKVKRNILLSDLF